MVYSTAKYKLSVSLRKPLFAGNVIFCTWQPNTSWTIFFDTFVKCSAGGVRSLLGKRDFLLWCRQDVVRSPCKKGGNGFVRISERKGEKAKTEETAFGGGRASTLLGELQEEELSGNKDTSQKSGSEGRVVSNAWPFSNIQFHIRISNMSEYCLFQNYNHKMSVRERPSLWWQWIFSTWEAWQPFRQWDEIHERVALSMYLFPLSK